MPAGHPMGYRDCFAAFVSDVYEAVRGAGQTTASQTTAGQTTAGRTAEPGAAPRYPTFADAARTAHITDAVLRSAQSRTWIEVS